MTNWPGSDRGGDLRSSEGDDVVIGREAGVANDLCLDVHGHPDEYTLQKGSRLIQQMRYLRMLSNSGVCGPAGRVYLTCCCWI